MSVAEKTVLSFLTCYDEAAKTKDIKLVSRDCTPDCKRYPGPASLRQELGGFPSEMSSEQYEAALSQQLPLVESSRTEIISYSASGTLGAYHVLYHTKIGGVPEEIVVENMGILSLTEDGSKIKSIKLFADSDGGKKYMNAFVKAAAMQQK